MYSFNEVFRSLADWFGVPSNIVVVDYPEGCESKEFNILRERLPSAYFIKCGKCIKDGGVFSSPKMLLDTIEEARKHALKDAFMIFTYTDTRNAPKAMLQLVSDTLFTAKVSGFKPVLINFYPQQFMNQTSYYYDDIVILTHKNKFSGMNEIVDKINLELLSGEAHEQDILALNAKLGNGPLIPAEPLLFSKPKTAIADTMMYGLLFYGLYKMFGQCRRRHKLKVG